MLPLVHEYQIQDLVDRCEEVTLTEEPSIKNLLLAETWGLGKLQQACLDGVGKLWTRKEILEDVDFSKLSSGLQFDVMSRKIELFEEQMVERDKMKAAANGRLANYYCDQHRWGNGNCFACKASLQQGRAKDFYMFLYEKQTK